MMMSTFSPRAFFQVSNIISRPYYNPCLSTQLPMKTRIAHTYIHTTQQGVVLP